MGFYCNTCSHVLGTNYFEVVCDHIFRSKKVYNVDLLPRFSWQYYILEIIAECIWQRGGGFRLAPTVLGGKYFTAPTDRRFPLDDADLSGRADIFLICMV